MKIIPNITVESSKKGGQKVTYPAGEECTLPDDVAQDLIDRGFATKSGDGKDAAAKVDDGKQTS